MAIFPKEILESTSEYYLDKIKVRSKIIYLVLLFAFVTALLSLPYIYVDLSIKSRGILAPKTTKLPLFSSTSGSVVYSMLSENAVLTKGDTFCIVDYEMLDMQIAESENREKEDSLYLKDLQIISDLGITHFIELPPLNTEVYRSAINELIQRLARLNNQITQTRIVYKRDKKLFKSQVLSAKEYEKSVYAYKQAQSNYKLAVTEKLAQWEMDKHSYKHQLEQFAAKIDKLKKEKEKYYLTAPISGVVQQYSGVRVGSFVYANQKLGEISPDSSLIAEMYISPTDIGFIAVGKKVKIQVDAFNYNQWGMLDAEIIEVADDISMINQAPAFKVKCTFNKPFLSLKNGYKGYLKKGMTLGGRIMITKRSLYQLLYDKMDDWLNPNKA